jgi:hypothetical protein
VAATDHIDARPLDEGGRMKGAARILLLIALAVVASMPGLGVNVFGVSVCEKSSEKIAVLDRIMVNTDSDVLVVTLKPTSSVQAGYTYTVDLYERGGHRASGTVVWSQIQANVQEAQTVSFSISSQEADEYAMVAESQLRKTFSIKVRE